MGDASDDDHETLEPHPDIHQDSDAEKTGEIRPDFLEKEKERDDTITDHHDPELNAIFPQGPPSKGFLLHNIVAVPSEKVFDHVGVTDDQACEDNGFGDIFQNISGNEHLIMEDLSHRDQ